MKKLSFRVDIDFSEELTQEQSETISGRIADAIVEFVNYQGLAPDDSAALTEKIVVKSLDIQVNKKATAVLEGCSFKIVEEKVI